MGHCKQATEHVYMHVNACVHASAFRQGNAMQLADFLRAVACTFHSQSTAVYSNSQQVTLPRQWILYCSASLYVPLRIEGHLRAQSVCALSCSAEHHAALVSKVKGCSTCCSVLPDGMLMSVVELAATADLMLQPIHIGRNSE